LSAYFKRGQEKYAVNLHQYLCKPRWQIFLIKDGGTKHQLLTAATPQFWRENLNYVYNLTFV